MACRTLRSWTGATTDEETVSLTDVPEEAPSIRRCEAVCLLLPPSPLNFRRLPNDSPAAFDGPDAGTNTCHISINKNTVVEN